VCKYIRLCVERERDMQESARARVRVSESERKRVDDWNEVWASKCKRAHECERAHKWRRVRESVCGCVVV